MNRMTLEKQLVQSVLDDIGKGEIAISRKDVENFFQRGKTQINNILKEKELKLQLLSNRIELFKTIDNQPETDSNFTPIKKILNDLYDRLQLAVLEFNNSKQLKYNRLIKRLRIAVMSKQDSEILRCLFDIDQLHDAIKDLKIHNLQDQIYKYSIMADEEGKVYLDLYQKHEERENILTEMNLLKTEITTLKTILEQ